MRVVCAVFLGAAVGLGTLGTTFVSSGQPDPSGWTWLPASGGYAHWYLYDLAWEGQYLSIELLLRTRGWQTPPPPVLSLSLQFSTFGSTLSLRVQMQRVAERTGMVTYFGQIVLARRDLNFGSSLCVKLLGGPLGVELGVHPSSLRVFGERSAFVGAQGSVGVVGGPLLSLPSPSPTPLESTALPTSPKTVRECAGMEDAPYLSPGRYQGELGWAGPGSEPDVRDWLRVNLWKNDVLELRVYAPKALHLRVLDPHGQEVGRVSGSGALGLIFQATAHGAHWICLAITESSPLFTYVLDLAIRR